MSEHAKRPSGFNFWVSAIFFIACFLLFAFLVDRFYLTDRSTASVVPEKMTAEERAQANLLTPEERAARLADLRTRAEAAATTYEWIDRENGVIRLPIERAMELTVQEHQSASPTP